MLELISWSKRKGERPRFKTGLVYLEEKRYSSAREYFKSGLTKRPDNAFLMAAYAVALAGAGDFPSARRFARLAMDTDSKVWQAGVCLAHCHNRLGDYSQQANVAKILLTLWPDEAGNHIIQADAYNNQGNFQRAVGHAKEAIRLKPELPHGHLQRGFAHLGMNNPENAVQDAERTLECNGEKNMYPLFFDHALAGVVYLRLGNDGAARKHLVSGLESYDSGGFPHDREAYKRILMILECHAKLDENQKPKLEKLLAEIKAAEMKDFEEDRKLVHKLLKFT
ncbi:tetratricopeptide repeat protein [Candidatus Woesearchaeota archaeon]|nr:tetratricopeptide repeat protein [Candidatus Woesearchaeota archaeon]